MSITSDLEQAVTRLRVLVQRSNGDILEASPALLESFEAVVEQVRNLEAVAPLNRELCAEFMRKQEEEANA